MIGSIVVCTIQVVVMHFFSQADVRGKILAVGDNKYLIDFSEEAKQRNFEGDYSKKMVDKQECIIISKP